jgi:tRNA A-37 threonylcarbamoyl transferase component Bud32
MQPGDSLDGRYTIIDRLGAGGMGEVYKATHNFLGSTRVIKAVHPHISSNTDARDRFLREARAATKVQHPNVATLHDFAALPDGAHYMVWEFIDGENLAQRLRARGVLPPRQAVHIAVQALRGLDAIHRAGIIHRDISPENLMITADDEVKIIDLGVAKVDDTDAVSQTRTGIFVGKLRYAAPEQLGFLPDDEKIDARADLYALAMVLVELLTGRPPYEAKSPHEYFLLHAREMAPKTVELPRDLPGSRALSDVLDKALARDRNQRYATAREFATALEVIERGLPDARDMATMAVPLDADETMRLRSGTKEDTLHRETQRTAAGAAPNAPAAATLLTPLPATPPPVAHATLQTPLPAAIPAGLPMRKGLNPAYLIGFLAIVALVVGALVFWPGARDREPLARLPQSTATTASTSTQAAAPATTTQATLTASQTSLTVTSPITDTTPVLSAPITTTTVPIATTTVAPPPVRQPRRDPAPTPAPAPAPAPVETAETPGDDDEPSRGFSSIPTYVDGGGDSTANDRALVSLRRALRGTNTVALRAGAMQVEVMRELREYFPNLQFEAEADVVIRFTGQLERAGGIGRRRRGAVATVEKNGAVVFRYELPNEVYRVGMSPARAFARVVAEAAE